MINTKPYDLEKSYLERLAAELSTNLTQFSEYQKTQMNHAKLRKRLQHSSMILPASMPTSLKPPENFLRRGGTGEFRTNCHNIQSLKSYRHQRQIAAGRCSCDVAPRLHQIRAQSPPRQLAVRIHSRSHREHGTDPGLLPRFIGSDKKVRWAAYE